MRAYGVLLLLAVAAAAQGAPNEAAAAVLAAKDPAVVKRIANADDPDPWLVADELCVRGAHDVALAFAKVSATPKELTAYVTAQKDVKRDPEDGAKLAKVLAAVEEPRLDVILATTAKIGELDNATRIFLLSFRAIGLMGMQKREECARVLEASAAAAERIGWWRRAGSSTMMLATVRGQLGDSEGACAAMESAIRVFERLGDEPRIGAALIQLGNARTQRGEPRVALAVYRRARTIAEKRGDRRSLAVALGNIALALNLMGKPEEALPVAKRSVELYKAVGRPDGVARVLGRIAAMHEARGDYPVALEVAMESLTASESIDYGVGIATALGQIGSIFRHLGEYESALHYLERSFAAAGRIGYRQAQGSALGNMAAVYYRLSRFAEAIDRAQRSHALFMQDGDQRGQAFALGHLGMIQYSLGNYPEAIEHYEKSLALRRRVLDKQGEGSALVNLGNVYARLGDRERATTHFERALALFREVGGRHGEASTLANLGNVHFQFGDHEQALALLVRALALRKELGDRPGTASVLSSLGVVHNTLGDHATALRFSREALALYEELGNRASVAHSRGFVAKLRLLSGDKDGMAELKQAIRDARWLRTAPLLVRLHTDAALAYLHQDKPREALTHAREATRELQQVFSGLGGELAASVRSGYTATYEVGTLAAMQSGELAEALVFLEDGRAGALLEALGGRRAARFTGLSKELHKLKRDAEAAQATARARHRRAIESGDEKGIISTGTVLKKANETMASVVERIQRASVREASVFYPRAAPLEEIQRQLAPDEAFVLYAVCLDEAVAFVLTRDGARAVTLGPMEVITAAAEAARIEFPGDARGLTPAVALPKKVDALRKVLAEPLKLDAKRILISPASSLAYVPFALLFDAPVTMTPSGTTHVLLRRARNPERGEKVLALGDPDYAHVSERACSVYFRGRALTRLPGTRVEAEAVGDTVLLGEKATVTELRKALAARPRWRAVHLACHGSVDPERAGFSSLVLAADKGSNGFLTMRDLAQMQIPADLVVLSACETGKGKVYRAEGVVGLTHAFMVAGAQRVIVSLWKVEDDATRALMVKFYEEWETHPAPVALKRAQDFVRGHKKWRDPYFWAAWQLWGLAD